MVQRRENLRHLPSPASWKIDVRGKPVRRSIGMGDEEERHAAS
jgi:hypothetical protein